MTTISSGISSRRFTDRDSRGNSRMQRGVLRQHRTIRQEVSAGIFVPIQSPQSGRSGAKRRLRLADAFCAALPKKKCCSAGEKASLPVISPVFRYALGAASFKAVPFWAVPRSVLFSALHMPRPDDRRLGVGHFPGQGLLFVLFHGVLTSHTVCAVSPKRYKPPLRLCAAGAVSVKLTPAPIQKPP